MSITDILKLFTKIDDVLEVLDKIYHVLKDNDNNGES